MRKQFGANMKPVLKHAPTALFLDHLGCAVDYTSRFLVGRFGCISSDDNNKEANTGSLPYPVSFDVERTGAEGTPSNNM